MSARTTVVAAALAAGLLTVAGVARAADGGAFDPTLLERLRLDHRTEALPSGHPVHGDLGETGLDLELPVAKRWTLEPGLHLRYVKDQASGFRDVAPTPTVALHVRF
jgi:hypothetical protein